MDLADFSKLRIGQIIRIIRIPEGVTDGPEFKTKTVMERCLGKTFPIADLKNGLVAIDVGELEGKASYMETVYLEQYCVETATENTSRRLIGSKNLVVSPNHSLK